MDRSVFRRNDMMKKILAFILVLALLLPVGSALAVKYYRVNTTWLQAHEKPDFSAKVTDSYRRDFAATISRVGKDGWVKVRFRPGGKMVFVQKKYLTLCDSYTAWISKDDTVLHTGPATSFKSLGKLKAGAKVTVLTHGAAFDFVSTSRGKGYVRNTHLTTTKPAATKKASTKVAWVKNDSGKNVVMRKGPGSKYKVIGSFRVGTKVTVTGSTGAWFKISYRGRTGYMMKKYLGGKD